MIQSNSDDPFPGRQVISVPCEELEVIQKLGKTGIMERCFKEIMKQGVICAEEEIPLDYFSVSRSKVKYVETTESEGSKTEKFITCELRFDDSNLPSNFRLKRIVSDDILREAFVTFNENKEMIIRFRKKVLYTPPEKGSLEEKLFSGKDVGNVVEGDDYYDITYRHKSGASECYRIKFSNPEKRKLIRHKHPHRGRRRRENHDIIQPRNPKNRKIFADGLEDLENTCDLQLDEKEKLRMKIAAKTKDITYPMRKEVLIED